MAVSIKQESPILINDVDPTKSKIYVFRVITANAMVLAADVAVTENDLVSYESYQIKETDMRVKTATFTTNSYFDLSDGKYIVWIISPHHENFHGVILSAEVDKDERLYTYQCQDYSRNYISTCTRIGSTSPTIYHLMQSLLTNGRITLDNKPTNSQLKTYEPVLKGLRPVWQYESNLYDTGIKDWNVMNIPIFYTCII